MLSFILNISFEYKQSAVTVNTNDVVPKRIVWALTVPVIVIV